MQDTLISVWRQVLVEGRSEVLAEPPALCVGFTRGKQLRTVAFPYGRHLFFGIEQNPRTRSRWAALAREGKRVIQFSYRGQYVANVCESTVFRYPAWKTLRLPQ